MSAENHPSLAQLCHAHPPVTPRDFNNLVLTYAKANGKLVNGFPVDLAGGRSAFFDEVYSAFRQSIGGKITITDDPADPYYGSIQAAFRYEVIEPMTQPGVMALIHQPPRPQPNPPPIAVSYPPQVAPVRQPPPRTVQPPLRPQGPPPEPPARPVAHGELPPEVREANTLYMSKLPVDTTTGEPIQVTTGAEVLAILRKLEFPAALLETQITVRVGNYGAYFIVGPSDNPEWADQIIAHKRQSRIYDSDIHLAYAKKKRAFIRPERKQEMNDQLCRAVAAMHIHDNVQHPPPASHGGPEGVAMEVTNEGANPQVSGPPTRLNNKKRTLHKAQATSSEVGFTSPEHKAQKPSLTPPNGRHQGQQTENPGRSMPTSPSPVNLFNNIQMREEGNAQEHDEDADDEDGDKKIMDVEDNSDSDN